MPGASAIAIILLGVIIAAVAFGIPSRREERFETAAPSAHSSDENAQEKRRQIIANEAQARMMFNRLRASLIKDPPASLEGPKSN